ncbi:hypothetical protein BVRB_1g011120 [Beta vulgaris subsp. vulgaris]|nr:hypothetical protein BVRB_1g011120 [Beta vulgaris subsp. vulgaris]
MVGYFARSTQPSAMGGSLLRFSPENDASLPGGWIRLVREAVKKGGEASSAAKKRTSAKIDVADIDSDRRRW